jgi:hypothetical protein
MELNNYCCQCGIKLKSNKKGYAGKNRKFHNTCLQNMIDRPMESNFNYIGKANSKIATDDTTRNSEYRNYYNALMYANKKRMSYF